MKRVFSFLLFLPILTNAQFNDNFEDADFNVNPQWKGDTGKFEVDTVYRLHLNAPYESDAAFLTTESSAIFNATWEFYIELEFNPSSNNYACVYLASDNSDLKNSLNGYFVKIGNTDDEISLYKQTGTTTNKIIDGRDDRVDNSEVSVRIKVTRDSLGNWELFSDTLGGFNYEPEGTTFDNDHIKNKFFGIFCNYTSTRSNKFYFDDFIVTGEAFIDSIPPEIVSLKVLSESSLELIFSEPITDSSAKNIDNFEVTNEVGRPDSILFNSDDGSDKVILLFEHYFPNGEICELTIQNITDQNDNFLIPVILNFYYYLPKAYDIVINEIMADPTPAIGLPEEEYIEIYNTTDYSIDLTSWKLEIGNRSKMLPPYEFNTDGYLILCHEDFCSAFSNFGEVICIESLPAITNTGTSITLKRNDGIIVSSVTFSDEWYNDSYKAEGGWSLEMIDPLNPCEGIRNWKVSESIDGGTPGEKNSIYGNNPDIISPQLIRATVNNDSTIILFFSEPLDSISALNSQFFTVDGIGKPDSVRLISPEYKKMLLYFSQRFETGIIYTINIENKITDCSGNEISENSSAQFSIPELPGLSDIVINEALFNPEPNCVDFVEIYNRSDKTIDLNNILIGTIDQLTNEPKDLTHISDENYLLFPETYLVLTLNPEAISEFYYTPDPDNFIKLEKMPSFANDEGYILIKDKWLNPIDSFYYDEIMHFPLLNSNEGVSLERIHFERPTNDKTNWHSAAETVGYATPGYLNSQFNNTNEMNATIAVEPEIFSPDNDGYNDVVNISISLEKPGWIGNIIIFNTQGQLIKELVNNELLATDNNFSWDGINRTGQKSGIGIYIIYIEFFDTEGHVEKYKKTCVLGAKL